MGNNAGASWDNGWTELSFGIQGTLDDYIGPDREIRIQLVSTNAKDNADIDYQAITVMGDDPPAANEATLKPISYTTISGNDGQQPVSNLYIQDQQNSENDWNRYLELQSSQEDVYSGYRTYILPNHMDVSQLTSITLKANFLGPGTEEQEWIWSIYQPATAEWVNLGNNEEASWEGGWKEFSYEAAGNLSEYAAEDREIRIQIASNNNVDNADLDYEALVVSTVGSEPLPEPWERVNLEGEGISTYDANTGTFNLRTKALSGKNTHYVYQERNNNFTAQGCIQGLTSDDPEAKAGLMLRQDNTDSSKYVYIGLMSTGTEVEYVDDTGTVQTVQGQQSSTPVCYKLEREENSVRVYESDDGLNWVLVTTIMLSLVDPVNIGLAVCASEHEVQAVVDDVVVEAQAPPGGIQAAFTATPTSGRVPLTVEFDASPSEGDNLTYMWDFGNGEVATGQQVSHIFTEAQQYNVTLTVENTSDQDTASQVVVVFSEDAMTQIEGDPNDLALQVLPMFFNGWDLNADFMIIDDYYLPTRLIVVVFMPNVIDLF